MTRFRLVLPSILVFALIAVVAAYADRRTTAEMTDGMPARSFEFTYRVHVPANSDSAGLTHLWLFYLSLRGDEWPAAKESANTLFIPRRFGSTAGRDRPLTHFESHPGAHRD
jgi:hypothetical protein